MKIPPKTPISLNFCATFELLFHGRNSVVVRFHCVSSKNVTNFRSPKSVEKKQIKIRLYSAQIFTKLQLSVKRLEKIKAK